jgi:hypothetical protein
LASLADAFFLSAFFGAKESGEYNYSTVKKIEKINALIDYLKTEKAKTPGFRGFCLSK